MESVDAIVNLWKEIKLATMRLRIPILTDREEDRRISLEHIEKQAELLRTELEGMSLDELRKEAARIFR